MKLSELTIPFETYEIIMYAKDGNTVVKRNIQVQQIKGSIYRGESYNEYGTDFCDIYAVYKEQKIGYKIDGHVDIRNEIGEIYSNHSEYHTVESFLAWMDSKTDIEKHWIREAEIQLAVHFDRDKSRSYADIKVQMNKHREEKAMIEAEERKAAHQQYVDEQNKIAEETIKKVENIIKSGGQFNNDRVTIYRDYYDSSEYSVVNYLMNKYGIKTPLRTKGWIKEKLVSVTVDKSGKCEQCQFQRTNGGKCSESFWQYMNELITAVRSEDRE